MTVTGPGRLATIPGLLAAALDAVAAHRSRAILGVLSIVVGVASVTLVVAIGDVGRAAAEEVLERQSGRPASYVIALNSPTWAAPGASEVADQLAAVVTASGGEAARVAQKGGALERGTVRSPIDVVATDPSLASIRRFRVVAGRWLQLEDGFVLGPVVVLNRVAADEHGFVRDVTLPVPVVLHLGEPVGGLVVGVVDDGSSRSTAYLALAALDRWTAAPSQRYLFVRLPPERPAPVLARLSALASRLDTSLEVQRTDDPRALDRFIGAVQLALGAIAALSLLTGAIGIVNLALAVVDQRTKEFAIRRAFGASQRDVFVIVLLESVITVGLGGLLGVVIALAGATAVGWVFAPVVGLEQAPGPPVSAALLGVGVTIVVGILVGIVPARRATTRSIIRAIRD